MRGCLVLAAVVLACGAWAAAIGIEVGPAGVQVKDGDALLMQYQVAPVPFKPYVKTLASPAGVNVLRDAPHDHLHHHALMFAIAADGVDFWAETPQCGKQLHQGFGPAESFGRNQAGRARFGEQLTWKSPKDEPVLAERRTILVYRDPALGASLLTWRTALEPAGGRNQVQLSGSHYFGLGMRFVESMDKNGAWIYPEKKSEPVVVRGDERLIRAAWCAYSAKADGKDVTVAMFDSPKNTRHPATWFTMTQPFSYISATLNLWKEPMTLKAGDKLDLTYGVAVWDGVVDPARIENLYQQWVELAARDARE